MIIGILGQSGSGKDTMADRLVAKYGFCRVSLADPLKRYCQEVYRFSDDQLWGPSELRNASDHRYPVPGGFLTPRKALQTLGTEWGRAMYEDTWIDYAVAASKRILRGEYYTVKSGFTKTTLMWKVFRKNVRGVVIPDVRFKNEITKIRAEGGVILRVRREGKDGNIQGGIKGHRSEVEQQSVPDSDVDHVIVVPEGIPSYHAVIDSVMSRILHDGDCVATS